MSDANPSIEPPRGAGATPARAGDLYGRPHQIPTEHIVTTLAAFVDQCWEDHANDPTGVAERIGQAVALVRDDDGVARLAMLAHHVLGEHLGRWDQGLQLLERLASIAVDGEAGRQAVARCRTSLGLCSGARDGRSEMTASDACRATAMAACSLAPHDTLRSSAFLEEAVASASAFPDDDPAIRSLASFGNNIAGTLQEKGDLVERERKLMLRAAEIARAHWERAGTWREVERAEYRLAVCWLAAGDGEHALFHARRCDALVRENGSEPLEVFFAAEALALAAEATGHRGIFSDAIRAAESSFDELEPTDQGWCRPTLDKLRARASRAV